MSEPVKTRRVIDEQISFALLADVFSLKEDIDRAVEAVSVRNIRAINPTLVAELFDGERQQFLIDLEAEVNLSALDVFFGQILPVFVPRGRMMICRSTSRSIRPSSFPS